MSSSVEPRDSAAEFFDVELASIEVVAVDVRDLQFPPCGRFQRRRDVEHTVVVKVQARDGVLRFWAGRLFFEADGSALAIEFDDTITFGIAHCIPKDRRALFAGGGAV